MARRTPPPPPPPFTEPEPRPLFAPDPPEGSPRRGVPAGSTQTQAGKAPVGNNGAPRSTGPGAGPLPSSWGPDADTPPPGGDDREWSTNSWERPGTSWLRLAAAVAALIVLVVALVFAFKLGKGSESGTSTSPSSGSSSSAKPSPTHQPVKIAAVSDFDPESSPPSENPELAHLATDGDPGTAWQTSTYYGRPDLGGLKSGVGLLLDLGKSTDVSKVKVTLQGSPTSLSLLAAPDGASRPTSTSGLKTVDSVQGAGSTADLTSAKPVHTRYLVVWLTSLPPVSGGFQGKVAEVNVSS